MRNKGLDTLFVNYGIRKEDMSIIENLCEQYDVDSEWVKEYLLKGYHEKKIKNEDLDERPLKKLLERAIQNLPSHAD